jgi:hypothetical protein
MTERCPHDFDDSLISGAIDGQLTQADDQRVRIHLEDCAVCRTLKDELSELREVTMGTEFNTPADDQWNELPKSGGSGLTRGLGWIFAIVWLLVMTGWGLWTSWNEAESNLVRFLIFGGIGAGVLLFLSVLFDRMKAARTDPYREVKR